MQAVTETHEAVLHEMAYVRYQAGKYLEASHLYRFLTLVNPIDARFWFGLASSLYVLREYREALQCFQLASIYNEDHETARAMQKECEEQIRTQQDGEA